MCSSTERATEFKGLSSLPGLGKRSDLPYLVQPFQNGTCSSVRFKSKISECLRMRMTLCKEARCI
jgi:hypothetical protein